MTIEARKLSGIILLTVPSIIYGGYFLLGILSGQEEELQLTDFQNAMFRAGHAHAGVLVILSLIIQLFTDYAALSRRWKWVARLSFPIAAILISGGFFAGAIGTQLTAPTQFIGILYLGMLALVIGLITLGIGLIRDKKTNP